MTGAFDAVDAAVSQPLALIPAAFAVAFVVRVERWYRLVPRAAEAIRSRIASGGES